jgi:hypothetical protein
MIRPSSKKLSLTKENVVRLSLRTGIQTGIDDGNQAATLPCVTRGNIGPFGCILVPNAPPAPTGPRMGPQLSIANCM